MKLNACKQVERSLFSLLNIWSSFEILDDEPDLELVDLELGGVCADESEVVDALVLGDVGADRGLPLPTHQVDPQGLLT